MSARRETSGLLLLGDDLPYLTLLSNELRALSRSITISAGPYAVRRALLSDFGHTAAAIVCIDRTDNVADVRALLNTHPATTFLFLTEASPPRSAMAHAIHSAGGEVLSRREEPVVIAATLIALMAQKPGSEERFG